MPSSSKNPLHSMHEQAEATFLPYSENLQIVESYGEPEAEYAAIRKAAALMDSPHRAVVILTGKDRLAFLHNKVTNDTNRLSTGQGCYAYLLNLKGRIVMDMNILHGEEATVVELDCRSAPMFLQVMEKYIFSEDVRILDGSEQLGRFTLLGPNTQALLKKILDADIEPLGEPLRHVKRTVGGKAQVTVFRNDQAGETQYELIVPRDQMIELWQTLHEAGNGHGEEHPSGINLRAIGWSAFNTARIEAGTPLYNIDFTENHLPMETGTWYGRAVSVTKGCYLGQEIVARMHAHNTVSRLLVGLRIEGQRLPLAGTAIYEASPGGPASAQQIGIITSSCHSPMLGNVPIALAYVKKGFAAANTKLEVLAEGGRASAAVTDLPFWKK